MAVGLRTQKATDAGRMRSRSSANGCVSSFSSTVGSGGLASALAGGDAAEDAEATTTASSSSRSLASLSRELSSSHSSLAAAPPTRGRAVRQRFR